MFNALSSPMRRGRRCVPPAPGRSPSLTSGRPSDASGAATRKCAPIASSKPPPRHCPAIAATTGFGLFSTSAITTRRFGSRSAAGVPNSVTSAPPEKARAVPVSTIAFTAAFAFASSSASAMPSRRSNPRPLTGGLFIVTTAMSPSMLQLTYAFFMSLPSGDFKFDTAILTGRREAVLERKHWQTACSRKRRETPSVPLSLARQRCIPHVRVLRTSSPEKEP